MQMTRPVATRRSLRYAAAMRSADFDRSEWLRRDERAARANATLLASVNEKEAALRHIFGEHRVKEAYLFGSIVQGTARSGSDVDIAVIGCPADAFYRLASRLERALGLPLDLVDLDRAPADFAAEVRRSGRRNLSEEDPAPP
jgi:predicted nucleotidyltransferase